jgi:hypothetical protein
MGQLHKRFTDTQVKELLQRYLRSEIPRDYIQEILGIGKTRFFALINRYREDSSGFSVQYIRKKRTRAIDRRVEKNILQELSNTRKVIENKDTPVRSYNYSYIKDKLEEKYHQRVSLSTIIDRAKKNGFYLRKPKRRVHDREVVTRYVGELIQHDSSYHLWAPDARQKWHLITSLDDCSRFILYAKFHAQETSWAHIQALESTFLRYGLPYSYYVDSHSIFRFVQGRDSVWRKHHLLTDDVDPQWKQVLDDCNVKLIYALSPQAKGKIERPYGWLQDRVVRTCVDEQITDIRDAQRILNHEVHRYNYKQLHSTTREVPHFSFKRALKEKKSLFREFSLKPPFQSPKDIFCLRITRSVDPYRRVSLKNLLLKVHKAVPHDRLTLRIYPLDGPVSEIRFWRNDQLLDVQRIKNEDLRGVHF